MEKTNNSKLFNYSLDEIVNERFATYSKYVIQERALPDVRDGLKPVQRRILYLMDQEGNNHSKPYRKSAKTVGMVIANYHPHGDTSVYDAMVRMSQSWKLRIPLISMHGNNGSIDDDPAAAMRYTEARLAQIAGELLQDIDKKTVSFAPNYDDTLEEPTVLPARFPNLLVNGAKGIAAGYATDIPPHNLQEIIDATIQLIKKPKSTLDELMEFIKGPDFPTGGIVEGIDGIKDAFMTGSGSVQIVSKTEIKNEKNCIQFIITEIPYEVIKSKLVQEIDRIRYEKEIDGIIEARDESDREGLKIVIEIRKEADIDGVVNYLMRKTQLSVRYRYNMVSIVNKTPRQLGIIPMLTAYIKHQLEVLVNKTKFNLNKAETRLHIIKGLIIAILNLDEVIRIIRQSKDKADSKINLQNAFAIDELQAEAIVTMQLYRLSSTDIAILRKEGEDLEELIIELKALLEDEGKQRKVIIKQLEEIKKDYPSPRLTEIRHDLTDFTIINKPIIKEDVMIAITRDGYLKRSSMKSFNASDEAIPKFKQTDMLIGVGQANTGDIMIAFTNLGNFIYIPIHEFPEMKWKEEGQHLNTIMTISGEEKIIDAYVVPNFDLDASFIICSYFGQITKIKLNNFQVQRYSKPIRCMKLSEGDNIVSIQLADGDSTITICNVLGKGYRFHEKQISALNLGVKGVSALKNTHSEKIGGMIATLHEQKDLYLVVTKEGGARFFHTNQLEVGNRLSRCEDIFKFYNIEPHRLVTLCKTTSGNKINILYATNGSIIHEFEDMHHSPLGKIMKNTLITNKDTIIAAADFTLKTISPKLKTYIPIPDKIEVTKVTKSEPEEKEDDGEQMSIFDDFI